MASLERLVPTLTSNYGPGVTIVSASGSNAWRAFDDNWNDSNGTYAWALAYSGDNTLNLKFDKPVTVFDFDVTTGYYEYTKITNIAIVVDGARYSFSTNLAWQDHLKTTKFKLPTPLRGTNVSLVFTAGDARSYIQEIKLWGAREFCLIEMDNKIFSLIDNKFTVVSETSSFDVATYKKYAFPLVLLDTTMMEKIKTMSDRFKIHSLK